jgi:accessory colonization factor AcfC
MALGLAASHAVAAEVIKVYGSEGPEFAVREAAEAFSAKAGVRVEFQSGTAKGWLASAKSDADVIFTSAAYMMTDLLHENELAINPNSVTSLYVRPSAILVRPGNPKGISDFPDLLKPGVRIMVVSGSGQTGLWEDMAGRRGNIETLREFHRNVLVFAPDSETAERTWRERSDIDAWLTWNTWYLPLHEHADLVTVSKEHVVYRQCMAAMTQRGTNKPEAKAFVEFLASPEGARIFSSWDWKSSILLDELAVDTVVAVVCRVEDSTCSEGVGRGLLRIQRLLDSYSGTTVSPTEVRIVAVVDGEAARWLLDDAAYAKATGQSGANPNKAIVKDLLARGVTIEVSRKALTDSNLSADALLPGISTVTDAFPRIVDLQLQGYAALTF